jgi:peptide chain release factor 2
VVARLGRQRRELEPWLELLRRTEEVALLAQLAEEERDEPAAGEVARELEELRARLERLESSLLFTDQYDDHNAIVSINAGAGGTESCDWVEMLARMYLRWAERQGYESEVIDTTPGDQAGSKSVTAVIRGERAYAFLRAERGVHRLVRISPFDSASRRHTSFASVEVLPEVEEADEVEIKPEELKVDTYRASSAGGQHVNKTDSAVRITHLPSGIVVSCQNERSQHRNRASALLVLKSRLLERQRREQEEKLAQLRGEQTEIGWGHQIRSYVLHPYNLVKDLRTELETSNTGAVLDGEVTPFMEAYLKQEAARKHRKEF